MNVCTECKEVHRVLYVHVFVSVLNFLTWNKTITYKKIIIATNVGMNELIRAWENNVFSVQKEREIRLHPRAIFASIG